MDILLSFPFLLSSFFLLHIPSLFFTLPNLYTFQLSLFYPLRLSSPLPKKKSKKMPPPLCGRLVVVVVAVVAVVVMVVVVVVSGKS